MFPLKLIKVLSPLLPCRHAVPQSRNYHVLYSAIAAHYGEKIRLDSVWYLGICF